MLKDSGKYGLLLMVIWLAAACQNAVKTEAVVKYESDAAVPRISAQDAKKAVDAGDAIFVDSRGETAFEQEHLPGAIVIPYGSGDEKFGSLPKGKKIIVNCSWPNEHTSAGLAFQMNQKGIPDSYALLGGPAAWKAAGYPVESRKPTANQ